MLKGAWKRTKGDRFRIRIDNLFWQIKYAWQRAWLGYDSTDVFNLDTNFLKNMLPILKEFKEHNICLWYDPDKKRELTKEEVDSILDRMIYLLENCDEDVWINMGLESTKDYKEIRKIEEQCYKNKKEFLQLFVKWFDNLWY